MRSPGCRRVPEYAAFGTISWLRSTATRRGSTPSDSRSAARVRPAATSFSAPFTVSVTGFQRPVRRLRRLSGALADGENRLAQLGGRVRDLGLDDHRARRVLDRRNVEHQGQPAVVAGAPGEETL